MIAFACGQTKELDGEKIGQTVQALTLDSSRILGFERAEDWSGLSGVSSMAIEGAASGKVAVDGWTKVTSVPLSSLGAVGDRLTVDVLLPALVSWGDVRIIVRAPSIGAWYEELARVSLVGRSAGAFHTLEFNVPADLRAKLSGTYSDLTFTVVVNGPKGTYLLDRLNVNAAPGLSFGPAIPLLRRACVLFFTPEQERILGFEQAAGWAGLSGNSPVATAGAASGKVAADGWTKVTSVALSSLGAVGDRLQLDIRLPAQVKWGDVRIIVRAPSIGAWHEELASVSLVGLSAGAFHTLEFPLSPEIQKQLGGSYSDLTFTVVVNAPKGTYLLDNLAVVARAGSDVQCACPRGWQGKDCSERYSADGPSGIPQSLIDTILPDVTTGLRYENAPLTPGPGLIYDRSADFGPMEACDSKGICTITQALTTTSEPPALSPRGPFRVVVTRVKEADNDAPLDPLNNEDETHLQIDIDGQGSVEYEVDDNTKNLVSMREVDLSRETVTVRLQMHEDDDFLTFQDEVKFDWTTVVIDNITGEPISGISKNADGEFCLSGGGSEACFVFHPAGRPAFCTGWNAQYIDSALGEHYAAERGLQSVPAAFATGTLEMRHGKASMYKWNGIFDRDGCIPLSERSKAFNYLKQDRTGQPLTVIAQLTTKFCLDTTGNRCNDGAGFATKVVYKNTNKTIPKVAEFCNKEDLGLLHLLLKFNQEPSTACVVITEDPAFDPATVPVNCEILRSGADRVAMTESIGGRSFVINYAAFDINTRVAGVVSTILAQEARTGDMGLSSRVSRKEPAEMGHPFNCDPAVDPNCKPLFDMELHTGTGCGPFKTGDGQNVCDSCAGSNTVRVAENEKPCPGESCNPNDLSESYLKYVIAHEFGHVVQEINGGNPTVNVINGVDSMGNLLRDSYLEKLAGHNAGQALVRCDHVKAANAAHCLQSWELPPAAQGEGFAQFFASKAFNDPNRPNCTFGYYKEMALPTCVPGAAACAKLDITNISCTPELEKQSLCRKVTSGLTINAPPVPVSCSMPVRWRNHHAREVVNTALNTGYGYVGTEWDWMTFFWGINHDKTGRWPLSGPLGPLEPDPCYPSRPPKGRLPVSTIGGLYESLKAKCNTSPAFDFEKLSEQVQRNLSSTMFQPQRESFARHGRLNGVGSDLSK